MSRNLLKAAQQNLVLGPLNLCLQGLCCLVSPGTPDSACWVGGNVLLTSWASESG